MKIICLYFWRNFNFIFMNIKTIEILLVETDKDLYRYAICYILKRKTLTKKITLTTNNNFMFLKNKIWKSEFVCSVWSELCFFSFLRYRLRNRYWYVYRVYNADILGNIKISNNFELYTTIGWSTNSLP